MFTTKLTKKKIPDHTKAKEHYKLLLKKQGETNSQNIQQWRIKFVTVKHFKTASNLLKAIKQSNINKQELENVKKNFLI